MSGPTRPPAGLAGPLDPKSIQLIIGLPEGVQAPQKPPCACNGALPDTIEVRHSLAPCTNVPPEMWAEAMQAIEKLKVDRMWAW